MTEVRGRVLVVMNRFQAYEEKIPAALRKIGFEAKWSDARPGNGFLVKVLTRLGLLQKVKSISRENVARIARDARAMHADTLLLISPENLRGPEIKQLRDLLPGVRIVLYLWDSAVNRRLDQDMIDGVDSAFSFDMNDCESYANLRLVPLFHQHREFRKPESENIRSDFDYCFIGTARLRRLKVLADLGRKARETHSRYFFFLFAPSFLQYAVLRIYALYCGFDGTLSRTSIPYQTYLDTLAKSACVIDVEQGGQGGLTIRTMDTVFAGRPLATTNRNIARHDFFPYFPINVFSESTMNIQVPQPRNTAQAEVYFQKYHIGNWLETILTDRRMSYRLDESPVASAAADMDAL